MSSTAFPILNRRSLVAFLGGTFGWGIVFLMILWLAGEVGHGRYATSFFFAIVSACFFLVLRSWRTSVYFLFSYILVEGFIINYFEGRLEINGLKDMQLLLVFLGLTVSLVGRGLPPIPHRKWTLPFIAFAVVYCLAALNPRLPNLVVGAVGIRVTLVMTMALAVGYWFFRDRADVMSFLRFQTIASIPISAFGIVQYFAGPSLLISISPGFSRAIYQAYTVEGNFFRTISTFASTGGFSHYLWITLVLTLALRQVASSERDRWLWRTALALQLFAMVTTGGRAPMVFGVFTLIFAHLLVRRFWKGVFTVMILSGSLMMVMSVLGPATVERFSSAYDLEVNKERNIPLVVGQLREAMQSPLEGYGAGIATSAANRLAGGVPTIPTENQFARIWYESGIVGLLLFASAMAMISIDLMLLSLRMDDNFLRTLSGFASSIPITAILIFPAGLPLDIPPINFYFWFVMGLVYALTRISAREHERPPGMA